MTTTQSCREKVTAEVPCCRESDCMGPPAARVRTLGAGIAGCIGMAAWRCARARALHALHACTFTHTLHGGLEPVRQTSGGGTRSLSRLCGAAQRAPFSLTACPTRR